LDCCELLVSNISQNVELLGKTTLLLKLNDNVLRRLSIHNLLESILIITFLQPLAMRRLGKSFKTLHVFSDMCD